MTTAIIEVEDTQSAWYRVTLIFSTGAPEAITVVDNYGKVLDILAVYDVQDSDVISLTN